MTDDLFPQYPDRPGWKRQETSALAAEAVAHKAPILRARVLRTIAAAPRGMTAHEVAETLGWDITSVRPRITELHDPRVGPGREVEKRAGPDGKPLRRPTPSGCSALVWFAVEAEPMARAA